MAFTSLNFFSKIHNLLDHTHTHKVRQTQIEVYSAKHMTIILKSCHRSKETKETECLNAMWCPKQSPKKRGENIKEKTAEILISGG